MERFIKKGRKRSYRLDKITLEDFVRFELGTKEDFYSLTGKKPPKIKEPVIEDSKPVKKGAGS